MAWFINIIWNENALSELLFDSVSYCQNMVQLTWFLTPKHGAINVNFLRNAIYIYIDNKLC